jgi:uncharacterized membrane protein
MSNENKTQKLVLTALLACLGTVAILIFRIPVPGDQGIIHLGDSIIFLAVLILGTKYAVPAAAIGHSMANILGGLAMWAPWTFVIKGTMALITGVFITNMLKDNKDCSPFKKTLIKVTGMILGGTWMISGYYVAGGIMFGNWIVALVGIPWNIGQLAVGIVVALALSAALCKTPAKKTFHFGLTGGESEANSIRFKINIGAFRRYCV